MRKSLIATLRKVHLVAYPAHRALGRVASLHLVGRFDAMGAFRHLFWVENPYLCVDLLVVLLPDLAKDLDLSKKLFEDLRCVRIVDACQKPHAISAHRPQIFFPGLLTLWQPLVFDTPSVTLEPLGIGVLCEPLRSCGRQSVEGSPHRLRGPLPFAQEAQSAQYMG